MSPYDDEDQKYYDAVDQEDASFRLNAYSLNETQPVDKVARALELSQKNGLPRVAIESDMEGYEAQDEYDRLRQLGVTAPQLYKWLSQTPDNYAVTKDEADLWGSVEKEFGNFRKDLDTVAGYFKKTADNLKPEDMYFAPAVDMAKGAVRNPRKAATEVGDMGRSLASAAPMSIGSISSGLGTFLESAITTYDKNIISNIPVVNRSVAEAKAWEARFMARNPEFARAVAPYAGPSQILKTYGAQGKAIQKAWEPETMGFEDKVAQGLGQLVVQIGMAMATGGSSAGLTASAAQAQAATSAGISTTMFMAMGVDQQAEMMRAAGVDPNDKLLELSAGGAITGSLEMLRLERVMKILPPEVRNRVARSVVGRVAGQAFEEGIQEGVENVLQNFIATSYDPNATIFGGVGEAAAVGGTVGGVFQAIIELAMPGKSRAPSAQEIDNILKDVASTQPSAGDKLISGVMEKFAKANLGKRSPEKAADLVSKIVEGTGAETVVIDLDGLAQSLTTAGMDVREALTQLGVDPDAIGELGQLMGTAEIPMGRLATPSAQLLSAQIIPHMRLATEDLTPFQKTELEDIAEMAKRYATDVKEDVARDASKLGAFVDVQEQIYTAAKGSGLNLTEEQYRHNANIAATNVAYIAMKRGQDVRETWAELGPKIMGRDGSQPEAQGSAALESAKVAGYQGSDRGEAESWVRAVEKGLDMSTEGRMARADEQFGPGPTLYHWTESPSEQLYSFTHVGTSKAAKDRFINPANGQRSAGELADRRKNLPAEGATYPVRINLKNVLNIGEDTGSHNPVALASSIARATGDERLVQEVYEAVMNRVDEADLLQIGKETGHDWLLDEEEFGPDRDPQIIVEAILMDYEEGAVDYMPTIERVLLSEESRDGRFALDAGFDVIASYLKDEGITALSYENAVEDAGSVSYIVPNPANIRSTNAAFDPDQADSTDLLAQSIRQAARMPMEEVNEWVRDNVDSNFQDFQNGDESAVMTWKLTDDPGAPQVMMGIRLSLKGRADVNLFLDSKMADAMDNVQDVSERRRLANDMFSQAILVMRKYEAETPDLKAFNFIAAESQAEGTNPKSREQLYRAMLSTLKMDGYTAYEVTGQMSVVNTDADGAKVANPLFTPGSKFVLIKDGVDVNEFAKTEILRGTQRGGDAGEVVTALKAVPLTRSARGGVDGGGRDAGRPDPGRDGQQGAEGLTQPRRGGYDPKTREMSFTGISDASTFLHENSHWFLATLEELAPTEKWAADDLAEINSWYQSVRETPKMQQIRARYSVVPDPAGGVRIMYQPPADMAGETPAAMRLERVASMEEAQAKIEWRERQEAWAETTEEYFMTGESPTPRLLQILRDFKNWLVQVYNGMLPGERANLTPEIRSMMDRILAVDVEVEAASAEVFRDARKMADEMLGKGIITPRQHKLVGDRLDKAREQVKEEMLARVMQEKLEAGQASRATERTIIMGNLARAFDKSPVGRAFNWLAFGEWKGDLPNEPSTMSPEEADARSNAEVFQLGRFETPGSPQYEAAVRKFGVEGMVWQMPDGSDGPRKARARAMGYNVDNPLYHGTDKDFEAFRTSIGTYGEGVYLTDGAELAGRYASGPRLDRRGAPPAEGSGPNIIATYVRGKIATIDDFYNALEIARSERPDINETTAIGSREVYRLAGEVLKARGFAGHRLQEPNAQFAKAIVIYDPANVRSVNAAFDPDNSESAVLLGQEQRKVDTSVAGGLTEKSFIRTRDLEGATIFPMFADLTDAGSTFAALDGLPIAPTPYLGGPNFPWLKSYRENGIVWAFNKPGVITKVRNKVKALQKQARAEGRSGRIVITMLAMKDDAHTSNEMVVSALLRTLDAVVEAGRFPQEQLAEAKRLIVSKAGKKDEGYPELATFPGFGDAQALHDWSRGATFAGRKALAKEMRSVKFQQLPGMFPVERIVREAIDPDYRATQQGDALLAFEIDPDADDLIIDFDDPRSGNIPRHPAYRYGMRGELVGSFSTHIPMEVLYGDMLPKIVARAKEGANPKFLMERLKTGDGQVVTEDIIREAEVIEGLHDYRIAQAHAAGIAVQWRSSDVAANKGGVNPVEFERALLESDAAATLTKYTREDVTKGKKKGALRVFQLGGARVQDGGLNVWMAVKKGYDYRNEYPGEITDALVEQGILTDNEVALVGVASNELGVSGMATFQVLKGIEEGVTVLDAFKVTSPSKPDGLLPTIYATLGFEEVGQIPFDPQYYDAQQLADLKAIWTRQGWNEADGYPAVAIMKWRGDDAIRPEATRRFILESQAGLGIRGGTNVDGLRTARRRVSDGPRPSDQGDGLAGQGDRRADPRRFADRARGVSSTVRGYVENILAADARAIKALKLSPELIGRIREEYGPALAAERAEDAPAQDPASETLSQTKAPVFYSALSRFIENSKVASATGAEWKQLLVQPAHTVRSAQRDPATNRVVLGNDGKPVMLERTVPEVFPPNVKPEEVEMSGVMEWLDLQEGPVTREAVAAFVAANGVTVKEVVKGGAQTKEAEAIQRELLPLIERRDRVIRDAEQGVNVQEIAENNGQGDLDSMLDDGDISRDTYRRVQDVWDFNNEIEGLEEELSTLGDGSGTKWSSYTLPGGENYTELLLTVPGLDYEDDHFEGVKGTIAHVRYKERIGPNGERVLALEEVQSGIHQAGRERGYKGIVDEAALAEIKKQVEKEEALHREVSAKVSELIASLSDYDAMSIFAEVGNLNYQGSDRALGLFRANGNLPLDSYKLAQAIEKHDASLSSELKLATDRRGAAYLNRAKISQVNAVPNAPFKNNAWVELVLKRMVRYAAENGFDTVAWIPGNVKNGETFPVHQATKLRMVSLGAANREATRKIVWEDASGKTGTVNFIYDGNGKEEFGLKNIIGEDAAKEFEDRLLNGEEIEGAFTVHTNQGWEWYDKILPNIANKFGKKYGARAERLEFDLGPDAAGSKFEILDADGNSFGRFPSEARANGVIMSLLADQPDGTFTVSPIGPFVQFHSLPITPQLREVALNEGFPLFQPRKFNPPGHGAIAPPTDIPPVRLDLKLVKDLYGEEAVRKLPAAVRRRSSTSSNVTDIIQQIEAVRKVLSVKRKGPQTLTQFIMQRSVKQQDGSKRNRQWGIKGAAGELRAMGLERLINEKSGMPIDAMRELAEEAGFIRAETGGPRATEYGDLDATPNDLLDALAREAKGEPVVRIGEEVDNKELDDAKAWASWLEQNGVDIYETDQRKLRASVDQMLRDSDESLVSPDDAAAMFGFANGEELLKALAEVGNRDAFLNKLADQKMVEEFGDMMTDGTLQAEAAEAARLDIAHRQNEIEMEALARALGQQASANYAKSLAKDIIAMRTVKEIAAYERDLNNERQFGKQALRLVEKGDYPGALKAKQRQLVSMQLYTEGKKAHERIEKQRQDLLKYYTSEGRRDKIAADYLEKIEDILERFELRVSKQGPSVQRERMSAAKYVAEMDAAGRQDEVAPEARLLAELNEKMTWRNMTSAEVEHLVGTIQNLAHLGRTKDSLLKAQEKRKFRAVIDSLVDRMNLTGKLPGVTRERSPTKTTTETLVDALREGHSWLMRPEHQARSLDGGELGPVWEAIFRPISEAGDVESRMMREATQLYREAWDKFTGAERNAMSKRSISVPELPGIGKRFTKLDLISVALNWGVTYNREVLMEGYGWQADQVEAALFRVLTDKDWDLVESIWEISGMYKAEAFQVEKDMTGVTPKSVEGISFTLPSGRKIDGKYYHIQYDASQPGKMSRRQAKDNDAEALSAHRKSRTKAMTKNGGLIERKGSGGRKVKLGLSVFEKALSETIHDIAFRRAVYDVGRIIADDQFADTYQEVAGMEAYRQLNVWLKDVAMPPMEVLDPIVKAFAHVRRNVPLAVMGYKVGTALIQPTGLLAAMPLVGHRRVLVAVAQSFANSQGSMYGAWKQVASMSELMRDRVAGYERDVRETTTAMTKGGALDVMRRNAFVFITGIDIAVSVPTWMAAWSKAMDGKVKGIAAGDQDDAVAFADSIIRRTQTAGKTQDLSRFQRGNEFQKQISQIFGYFNNLYSLSAQQTLDMRRGNLSKAQYAWHMTVLFVAIPLFGELLAGRLIPDDDDEDEATIEGNIATTLISNFSGMFPGIRDAVSLNLKPEFGYRMSPTAKFMEDIGKTLGLPAQLLLDEERELTEADVKRAVNTAGALTGLPSAQINISGDYIVDLLEGSEDPMADPADAASEALVRNTR
jgi:hypothetical protein